MIATEQKTKVEPQPNGLFTVILKGHVIRDCAYADLADLADAFEPHRTNERAAAYEASTWLR